MVSSNQKRSLGAGRANRSRIWVLCGLIVIFGWPFLLTGLSSSLANVRDDAIVIVSEWIVTIVLAFIGFLKLRRASEFFGLRVFSIRDVVSMHPVMP